jgi:1-acyl-sn-glycerol-3-phosphate acyltransferase
VPKVHPESPGIPYPDLAHWSFPRQPSQPLPRYRSDGDVNRHAFNLLMHRLMRRFGFFHPTRRYALLRVVFGFLRFHFWIWNRATIKYQAPLPDRGIFYCNHPGSLDPAIFLALLGQPVACFVGYGNYWFATTLEYMLGFINRERGGRDWLIERMIRTILLKNRYFAIWPEGRPSYNGLIYEPFSSIARVYATLNAKKDVIPLIPVMFRGGECYKYNLKPHTDKISMTVLPSYYLPRDWLKHPDDGGKTPREMVEYMMRVLMDAYGQKRAVFNDRIDRRRKKYLGKLS